MDTSGKRKCLKMWYIYLSTDKQQRIFLSSSRLIILVFFCFLLFCTSCRYGYDDELNIVIPTTEVANVENKVIAHRGAWSEKGLPENSLAAFKAALHMDIYGVECDVRQTKDGRLVICHDAIYDGLTISQTNYFTLSQHPLANGEPLPLLDDFLTTLRFDTGKVRLVADLKSCDVRTLLILVDSIGVLNRVDFISFSKSLCSQLVRYGLGYKTFFLNGTWSPKVVLGQGLGGIDYSDQLFSTHPEWIDEARALGLKVWVWTVNDSKSIQSYLEQGVYVTTDRPIMASTLNIDN